MEALIVVLLCLAIYFAPAIVASNRGHRNFSAIFVLNLFLGWTLVGWVIALVWAHTNHGEVIAGPDQDPAPRQPSRMVHLPRQRAGESDADYIARLKVQAPRREGRMGTAGWICAIVIAGVAVLIIRDRSSQAPASPVPSNGSVVTEEPREQPTCHSDWRLCSSNEEMANEYGDWVKAQVACQYDASSRAQYGSPTWPWLTSFSTFLTGDSYVKTGRATLIEKNAEFQNAFGAMAHSTVTCVYDLSTNKVLEVKIVGN